METEKIIINLEKDINSKKIQKLLKRTADVVFSIIGITVLSPVLIVIYVAIKVDSKGPAIFKQIRVGKDGENFTIYKFRTMIPNAKKAVNWKLILRI